jgi:hypothetical protein
MFALKSSPIPDAPEVDDDLSLIYERVNLWSVAFESADPSKWPEFPVQVFDHVWLPDRQWGPLPGESLVEVDAGTHMEPWARVLLEWMALPVDMIMVLAAISESSELFWRREPWPIGDPMPLDVVRFINRRTGLPVRSIRRMERRSDRCYAETSKGGFCRSLAKLQRWQFNIDAMVRDRGYRFVRFPSIGFGADAARVLDWSLLFAASGFRIKARSPGDIPGSSRYAVARFAAHGPIRHSQSIMRSQPFLRSVGWIADRDFGGDLEREERLQFSITRHADRDLLVEMFYRQKPKVNDSNPARNRQSE